MSSVVVALLVLALVGYVAVETAAAKQT